MLTIVCLTAFIHHLCAQQYPILFVSPNGTDLNNTICSDQHPCGTLYHATSLRQNNEAFNTWNNAEIVVSGINSEEIDHIKGIFPGYILMPLIITFHQINVLNILNLYNYTQPRNSTNYDEIDYNPFIIQGWMPSDNKLVINNLIVQDSDANTIIPCKSFLFLYSGTLVINNLLFDGIELLSWTTALSATNIEIYDSTFSNLRIQVDNSIFMQIYQGYLIMQDTIASNLYLSSTNFIFEYNIDSSLVENCHFSNCQLSDNEYTMIKFSGISTRNNEDASAYINNSSFNNISKSAIRLSKGSDFSVSLNTVNFIISHLNSSDLLNDDAALIMVSETAKLVMNNINVMYKWMDNIHKFCGRYHFSYVVSDDEKEIHYVQVPCEMPYRFISNTGSLIMNNIYITNDLNQIGLHEYRNSVLSPWGYTNHTIFDFYFYANLYSTTFSMMYNDRGQMIIRNMTLYGAGLHDQILHNTGIVFIDTLNVTLPPWYYNNKDSINTKDFMRHIVFNEGVPHSLNDDKCQDDRCYFDDIDAKIGNAVIIINSELHGGRYSIQDQYGSIEIYNTLIADTRTAIYGYKSNMFKIKSSYFRKVGYYHLGDFSSVQPSNDIHTTKDSLDPSEHIYFYDVEYILMEYNIFDFYPKTNYLSIYTPDNSINTITEIINNEFLNPLSWENFNFDHFEEFANIAADSGYSVTYHGWTVNYELHIDLRSQHLVSLEGYIKSSTFIGNVFHQNDIIQASLDTSCLYVNDYNWFENSTSFHCISGNIFYGLGLHLAEGQITSCFHPELLATHNQKCWQEFGKINHIEDNIYDYFIATHIEQPIIKVFNQSHIILDHAIITTNLSDYNESVSDIYHPLSDTEINGIISFLDVIIDEIDNQIEIQFHEECVNLCTKLYQSDINYIHQLHLDCMNISKTSYLISLIDTASNETFIDHLSPMKILLLSSSKIYPGGTLDIDFQILDSKNNIIDDYTGDINIIFTSNDFNFESIMSIEYDNNLSSYQCDICKTGLYIQKVRMDQNFESQYLITANVENNLLFINNLTFNVTECPSGYGLNFISSQCYECNIGECSMTTSRSPCYSCNNNSLNGIECLGSDKLRVSQNYWTGVDGINFNLKNEHVVSQYCPLTYCNQQHNGLYLDLHETNALCAINRDPNIPLCGKCIDGFSELFGSANCGICDRNRWELWIVVTIIGVLLSVVLMYNSAVPSRSKTQDLKSQKKSNCSCCVQYFQVCSKSGVISYSNTALFKPLLYYYQSVIFVLLNGGIFVSMTALAEVFNFQIDFGETDNDNESGYCWLKGLTAKYEIILRLMIPAFCLLTLTLIFFIYWLFGSNDPKFFGRYALFGKAFIKILLLTIGTICGVCFKLIACRSIGDNLAVHFYFGNDECYGITWWISMCILIFFVILFCSFFIKLYVDHRGEDAMELFKSNTYILESFVKSYKVEKYWFWEIIMFSRRLMVAMICIITEDYKSKHFLLIMIMIFMLLQAFCKPFQNEKVNNLEVICLLCLLILLNLSMNHEMYQDNYLILSSNLLIILPFIVFLVQMIMIICYKNKNKNTSKGDYNHLKSKSDIDLDKAEEYDIEYEWEATNDNDMMPAADGKITSKHRMNSNAASVTSKKSVVTAVLESDSNDTDDEIEHKQVQMIKITNYNQSEYDGLQKQESTAL